ncbi:MAG: hypothetical protein MH186_03280 [Marinobacter sp.]|nr:hypothetical protein [Marinobacter sp.]
MARTGKAHTPSQTADEILHRAARIEDTFHRWRERRGRKRGLTTTLIPYSSYGAPDWARVLCRVVLTRGTEASKKRAEKVRGWRSFFSIPVNDEVVTVTIGGTDVQLTPGRGGVIDEQVSVSLAPGLADGNSRLCGFRPCGRPHFRRRPEGEFRNHFRRG